jgi:hypothetical protein
MSDVLQLWIDFLGNRAIHLLQLNLLPTFSDKWMSACNLVAPSLPPSMQRTGMMKFPPSLYNGECAIVLCNHLSDLDWAIILAYMNPQFVAKTTRKRLQKRASSKDKSSTYNSNNSKSSISHNTNETESKHQAKHSSISTADAATDTEDGKEEASELSSAIDRQDIQHHQHKSEQYSSSHEHRDNNTKSPQKNNTQSNAGSVNATPDPLRPTAFTHRYFADIPVIGSLVRKHLITLQPKIDDEDMVKQIRQRQHDGCNVFVLFPEGGILDKSKYTSGQEFWKTKVQPNDPYEYKELLYPRFRAYQSLVETLGSQLKYIVDITLMYGGDYQAKLQDWNYNKYPSLIHGAQHRSAPARMHTDVYPINGRWNIVHDSSWLIRLWKLKDQRLCIWRQEARHNDNDLDHCGDSKAKNENKLGGRHPTVSKK